MKHHLSIATAAVALLLVSSEALATPHIAGHTAFSNVNVEVIDLTPGDNHAAGYSVIPRLTSENGNVFTVSYTALDQSQVKQSHPITTVPVHLGVGNGSNFAELHAEAGIGNMNHAIGVDIPVGYSSAYAGSRRTLTIILEPFSALSISGYAEAVLGLAQPLNWHQYFSSDASMTAQLRYESVDGPTQRFSRSLVLDPALGHAEFGEAFSFSAVNDRDHDIELTLYLDGDTSFRATLLPIPEPSTWLMLAAGLCAIAARRGFSRLR